jgi:mannonate dehydratase
VLRVLLDAGFDGFVMDDHVPHVVDDTVWGHRSRAYATGHIAGILRALRA